MGQIIRIVVLAHFVAGVTSVVSAGEANSSRHYPEARFSHTATLLKNGRVLVVGGCGEPFIGGVDTEELGCAGLASAELYDPAKNSWTATKNLSVPRIEHTATLLANGKVLVAGGASTIGGKALSGAELYDPTTGTWSKTGDLATPRVHHTATLLTNGKVLVVGGSNEVGVGYSSAELYDPVTGKWINTGRLSAERIIHTATLTADNKVLVVGGYGVGKPLTTSELYDPTTGLWTKTGNLTFQHGHHTATLLANGKVFVTGGCIAKHDAVQDSDRTELYDPATRAWSRAAHSKYRHCLNTATLLPNGKVLITGGNLGGKAQDIAEIYDVSRDTWIRADSLSSKRSSHTATLLPDGKVLIAGGAVFKPGAPEAIASSQEYVPSGRNR